jgi:arylsulfatase A-like enzyme
MSRGTTRRDFLKASGLALASMGLGRSACAAGRDRRPNIVYIMTDQQFGGAMSCTGNPYLRTPAMDRIAAMGVRFDRAYCAFPLCVPSRAAMFSSHMPHESGVYINCNPSSEPFPFVSLGRVMSDAGYDCHYVGKWHLTIPTARSEEHGFAKVELPGGHGHDAERARRAAEFLRREHDRPFFLVVSLLNPHDCCQLARGEDLAKFEGALPPTPAEDELPPLPDNFEIPTGEPDQLRAWQKENSERVYRSYFWDERQFREYLWGYYRLVEMVDAEIGKVLDALHEAGREQDTVVIYASDHGDGHSRHRWNQKWSLYEESARVPFIVAQKGRTKAGQVDRHLVSSGLDLMPTICDYAGVEAPEGCLGRSVRALAEGRKVDIWRQYVVSETSFGNWGPVGDSDYPKARMVRTERYKYIAYDKGQRREQLIDMDEDPGEMVNLADRPELASVLERHRSYLAQWCCRTNDPFELPFTRS